MPSVEGDRRDMTKTTGIIARFADLLPKTQDLIVGRLQMKAVYKVDDSKSGTQRFAKRNFKFGSTFA